VARGLRVTATSRAADKGERFAQLGLTPLVSEGLTIPVLEAHLHADTCVLVTFPPDGVTDVALAETVCARSTRVVYLSSTAVYGEGTQHIDATTPAVASNQRGQQRLLAEAPWLNAGATVVRAPGIYGPGRGLHHRLVLGTLPSTLTSRDVTSRIHVDDLARALLLMLLQPLQRHTYVIADDRPASHYEILGWIAARLGLPKPSPIEAETQPIANSERRVDGTQLRNELALQLEYPTYREGYEHCLAVDHETIREALAVRARLG
ncbi:MAG TPA: NAD-dependent epimerase/dehydratase family protein, partial [Polyangiales bacterium]|nr:NAD-dependent epimerase/dehydratase family protein [Polyangiales bacterium]